MKQRDDATVADKVDLTPLVVDLDGTLIRSDLLIESYFGYLGQSPIDACRLLGALGKGKASFKASVAKSRDISQENLPYDERVLKLIEEAKAAGRKVYLASASNERYVARVAAHIGADGWFASSDTHNLSGSNKAARLQAEFGDKGFDYAGNSAADLPIWAACRQGWAFNAPARVQRVLKNNAGHVEISTSSTNTLRNWIRLIRAHQWVKNILVFVPLIASHKFLPISVLEAVAAFVAFSFAASAIYIINDLVDLEADRRHPTKRRRPLAAGTVSIMAAVPAAALLASGAVAIAYLINIQLVAALAAYLAATTAYSLVLKRKMLIDVIVLAMLYTLRVFGGAAAIGVPVSEWLVAFSMFIFTSLALIKRYEELGARLDRELPDPSNRNYLKTDLSVIGALAAASGFNAITVFALYVSSETVQRLYSHPKYLWLVCPILMYWLSRAIMMAHRRLMGDDPIVFAIRDRNSILAFMLIASIFLIAV